MRVFIAVELPEHVKSRVFHEFEILQKKNLFKGKFVEKNNLHLTLKFIGETSLEKIDEIKKRLKEVKFEKLNCGVGKTGVFDSEKHIKIIWVELLSDKLKELQVLINEKFPEISSSDYKEFNSHITTARVKEVINREKLIDDLKKINFKKLDFEISEFLLMKSELTAQGPIYRIIEKFKLN